MGEREGSVLYEFHHGRNGDALVENATRSVKDDFWKAWDRAWRAMSSPSRRHQRSAWGPEQSDKKDQRLIHCDTTSHEPGGEARCWESRLCTVRVQQVLVDQPLEHDCCIASKRSERSSRRTWRLPAVDKQQEIMT